MPVRITCPHCRHDLRLPDELYEGPVQCPVCDEGIALRWHPRGAGPEREAVPTVLSATERIRRCPFCGGVVSREATSCVACGEQWEG
jgi:hypothetical protein